MLFDLDGVLVDSTACIERQWREWAAARGLDPAPFLRYCHGRRAVETIRLAAPELDAEAEVARFAELAPGEDPVLPAFPGARAVVTSGTRRTARHRLAAAGLPVPAVLVAAEDVRHGKPDPECYLTAAGRLGVPPEECVVIEDAPPGIEAARAAGMRVVAVTTTHPAAELRGATVLVGSVAELRAAPVEPAYAVRSARDSSSSVRAAPPRIALTSS